MTSPGRESAIFLGALAVLSAGAIALSLATSPPVAQQQLHAGAGATAGVGNFVMDLTNTVTTRASSPGGAAQQQSSKVHFVYQSPDSIQETVSSGGRSAEFVVIGNHRWERMGTGHWVSLPASPAGGPSAGKAAVDTVVLLPATAASMAESVVRHGKTSSAFYTYGDLPAATLANVDRVLFGVPTASIAAHAFDARIDKEYMTGQSLAAEAGNQIDILRIRYSELGTAPPVVAPTPSPAG